MLRHPRTSPGRDGRPFVRLEGGAHDLRRAGQPRLHRPERDSEGVRGVREREPEIVVEDDHRPLLRREPPEAAIELVADRDGLLRIAGRRVQRLVDIKRDDGMAPVLLGGPVAGPHEHPMEPRVETIGVAQPAQVPPRADERVLDRISARSSSRRIRRATANRRLVRPDVSVENHPGRHRVHEPQGRARFRPPAGSAANAAFAQFGPEARQTVPSSSRIVRRVPRPRLLARRPVRVVLTA